MNFSRARLTSYSALNAEVGEQLALLADAGREDAVLEQPQVLLLGLDAGGDDLARLARSP